MTRMSPVGSLACVSCLKFNLHSVDSSHSCSFKTKVLRVSSPKQQGPEVLKIRAIGAIRVGQNISKYYLSPCFIW